PPSSWMKHAVLLWILLCSGLAEALEPISTTIAAGIALTGCFVGYPKINCYFRECCQPDWISFNQTGLWVDLERRLFGQHLASRIILKAVNRFMNNDNPKKPLVLSLHGPAGTGKNFVSKMIADNIYKEGMDSKFVHVFIATHHFQHVSQIEIYKTQLKQWIKGNVSNCERSMFIFDEMDKMPPGLIDSIKPYLDYYDEVDGVSYRKAIFTFLSNAGGQCIVQTALEFWKAGRDREEIKLRDLENALSLSVFDDKSSGLWHSSLIEKHMVDFFVPFLPLEHKHVVQCALAEMKARGLKPYRCVADQVAKDFMDFPKSEKIFSGKGCKTIVSKLDFYV
uniref:Torsin n=1 Tax=Neogobius melanostomus TaxID=47308 RepID=A0A8C6U9M6_9GOBI